MLQDFRTAIERGDVKELRRLLADEPIARANVNTPMFAFDSRPLMAARQNPAMVDLLLAHGADINLKSNWWAGGFGLLETADPVTGKFLISRGAIVDIFAAAHLNHLDRVRELLDADPSLVNAKGGDGGRPLHFAGSIETIDLLLNRGAEIDARDVDHEGTPAQWAMPIPGGNLDRVRHLVRRGATVDIFMAAALDDLPRLTSLLQADPSLIDCQVGSANIPLCPKAPGGHQYIYTLGAGKSPVEIAAAFGASAAVDFLIGRSTPRQRLFAACMAGDRSVVEDILRGDPDAIRSLPAEDQGRLASAAWSGNAAAVKLMLDIGFDPTAAGPDAGGTALHNAAWHGRASLVELLLAHPAVQPRLWELLKMKDRSFKSSPLGWCSHGSVNCRNPAGDYPRVARLLLGAGAVAGSDLAEASTEVQKVLE